MSALQVVDVDNGQRDALNSEIANASTEASRLLAARRSAFETPFAAEFAHGYFDACDATLKEFLNSESALPQELLDHAEKSTGEVYLQMIGRGLLAHYGAMVSGSVADGVDPERYHGRIEETGRAFGLADESKRFSAELRETGAADALLAGMAAENLSARTAAFLGVSAGPADEWINSTWSSLWSAMEQMAGTRALENTQQVLERSESPKRAGCGFVVALAFTGCSAVTVIGYAAGL